MRMQSIAGAFGPTNILALPEIRPSGRWRAYSRGYFTGCPSSQLGKWRFGQYPAKPFSSCPSAMRFIRAFKFEWFSFVVNFPLPLCGRPNVPGHFVALLPSWARGIGPLESALSPDRGVELNVETRPTCWETIPSRRLPCAPRTWPADADHVATLRVRCS